MCFKVDEMSLVMMCLDIDVLKELYLKFWISVDYDDFFVIVLYYYLVFFLYRGY